MVQKFLVLAILSAIASAEPVDPRQNEPDMMKITHEGVMRFSKRGASLSGIGKSEITIGDRLLTVDGQFRVFGSTKIFRVDSEQRNFKAKPVLISLVALGNIQLTSIAGNPGTRSAKKAVYLFQESRWILDDEPWVY